jgi:DNA-binding SARP family transcriptional activator/tetratricopeptide (TPR) repeat protein
MAELSVNLLGQLEARRGDRPVALPRGRSGVLLAALALSAGRAVSLEALQDHVWGERLPQSAKASLHSHVLRLRRILGAEAIRTAHSGYLLDVVPDQVDVLRFRRLAAEAAGLQDAVKSRDMLAAALSLWRGEPLEGVYSDTLHRDVATPLVEERLTVIQRRIELDLSHGRHGDLVAELRELTGRWPMRETLWEQLMTALSAAGRKADALDAYHEVRGLLSEQLGVDPSGELQDLYHRILTEAPPGTGPARLAGDGGEPAPGPPADGTPAKPGQDAQAAVCTAGGWRARNDLPGDTADFTGRDRELSALLSALSGRDEAARTVLVSAVDGMAGVGKTALAVHAARLLADRYPDGQLFIDLHGHTPGRDATDPADALDSLLRAIGVPGESIPRTLDSRAGLWRAELAGRRVLVLLDNAATAAQVRPLIPGAAGCLVLITSRRRLTTLDGARTLSLDVLPPGDALDLFAAVAGPGRAAAEPGAAHEVLRLCGYLPLAIRISAARLAARSAWTVGYLAERLSDQGERLAELSTADRSVAAAFAVSYQQLAACGRRLFRRLGLHAGPDFDAYLAAAIGAVTLAEARRGLDDLVDAHLLQEPAPGRYRFHDLLRDHARAAALECDPGAARSEAIGRALDYHLHMAHEADSLLQPGRIVHVPELAHPPASTPLLAGRADALSWCDREYANLMSAISYASAHSWHGHAWMLPRSMWFYFYTRRHMQDWIDSHRLALTAASRLHDDAARAQTLQRLGIAYWHAGHHAEAADCQRQALGLFRSAGDRAGEAAVLSILGQVHLFAGRYPQGLGLLCAATDIYDEVDDGRGRAVTAYHVAGVYWRLGRYSEARDRYREALAAFRLLGDGRYEGASLGGLGVVYEYLGQTMKALGHQQRALRLWLEAGDRVGEAGALNDLGNVYRQLGRPAEARDHHHQALSLLRQAGDSYSQAQVLNDLGVTSAVVRAGQAAVHHGAALVLATDTGNPYEQARAHLGSARALYRADPAGARRHRDQARAITDELGIPERHLLRANLTSSIEPGPQADDGGDPRRRAGLSRARR